MSPLKQFKCSICGASCPKEYLEDGKFEERMRWLMKHRQYKHPRAFRESIKKGVDTRKRKKKVERR